MFMFYYLETYSGSALTFEKKVVGTCGGLHTSPGSQMQSEKERHGVGYLLLHMHS